MPSWPPLDLESATTVGLARDPGAGSDVTIRRRMVPAIQAVLRARVWPGPLPTGLPVPGLPGLHVDDVRELAGLPDAALGAIVIYAAIRLIDIQAFRRLLAFRRSEMLLALGTWASVLALGILYGCRAGDLMIQNSVSASYVHPV